MTTQQNKYEEALEVLDILDNNHQILFESGKVWLTDSDINLVQQVSLDCFEHLKEQGLIALGEVFGGDLYWYELTKRGYEVLQEAKAQNGE